MKKINNRGFTLIEVLVVIVIIAILGIIAVPNVLNTIIVGKDKSYQILVGNIKTASIQLFEELEFTGEDLFLYDVDANKTSNKIIINTSADNKEKYIEVNLQTLVSNGFLSGINNEGTGKKNILNPKTMADIGACMIEIEKKIENNSKINYKIISSNETNDENCPTTNDYK